MGHLLSKEWRASREGFLATYRKTLRYLVILAVPVAVAVYFLGDRALLILFGKEYLPSIPVLKVLAFGIIPFFIIQVNSIALISMDRQGAAVWAAVIGSLAAVIFSLILVPFHGPLGAALSRTLALLCLAVGEFVLLSRSMSWQGMWSTCSRSLISGSIMALVLLFFSTGGLSLPLLVAGCSSVYIAALLITGEITFREVRGFSSLLSGIVRSFKPGKD
jgi:O-antigen/teichoic acid export membrane protein